MSHADQSMIRWIDFAFWNRILKEKDQKNGPECWQESNRGSDSGQNQEEKRGNKYKKEDWSSGLYRNGNRCDHRFRNFRFTAHSDQWYWNRNCTGTAGDDCIHLSQDDSKCLSVVGSTGIRKLFYRTDEADPSGGWCIYGGTESVTAGIDLCVCGVVWRLFCGAVPGAGRI